ncbi:hypothetical protein NT6N_40010 [Oceaniferula spumae]|uniref:DUF4149 domain-containing protein n=1 Tax=Oceaniferula spumae TaxID=2979115 RepID=A0AAT9FSK7_9BACT
MITHELIRTAVILAGVGQLILVVASAVIPRCLDWKGPLGTLPKLMRQLFWTYAGYILGMHLFFGVISTFGTGLLLDGTRQAAILCALMMTWWAVRIGLQFFCFDRKGIPQTRFNVMAEVLLVCLFLFLAITYGYALWHNVGQVCNLPTT